MKDIFQPYGLGEILLSNRLVMAPMTRNRADANGVVTPMMVTHYQQRASAGLIISESAPISPQAIGYPFTPGIFTSAQVQGWRKLTDAVHQAGGHIFVQLQHCGRISHPSFQPENTTPVSASALHPEGQAITYQGMQDYVTPRSLPMEEISDLIEQFRVAAKMAQKAGFDGIEVHGANGYIIDQFLRDGSNQRHDGYGGNIENRMRLLNEILDAVIGVWPATRVGVRLTPENTFNSMSDSDPQSHFAYILQKLSLRGLAYAHVLEGDMMTKQKNVDYSALRSHYNGVYLANNGYDLELAQRAVESGHADLIAFGTAFLANPDLVRRYKENLPLNQPDYSTFYAGDEKGYNDYPIASV